MTAARTTPTWKGSATQKCETAAEGMEDNGCFIPDPRDEPGVQTTPWVLWAGKTGREETDNLRVGVPERGIGVCLETMETLDALSCPTRFSEGANEV
eukprot:15437511-Alexandrium_andersonii.AAC.1